MKINWSKAKQSYEADLASCCKEIKHAAVNGTDSVQYRQAYEKAEQTLFSKYCSKMDSHIVADTDIEFPETDLDIYDDLDRVLVQS